jgi:hypothetical protein
MGDSAKPENQPSPGNKMIRNEADVANGPRASEGIKIGLSLHRPAMLRIRE